MNYKHPVDVPVTDMDDPEDDLVFDQFRTNFDDVHELDEFDFDAEREGLGRRLGRMLGFFKPPVKEQYEMIEPGQRYQMPEPGDIPHLKRNKLKIFAAIALPAVTMFFFMYFALNRSALTGNWASYSNGTHTFNPTTILISLDGFHPHYISKRNTPALHHMFVNDYGAPYMKPSFPSSTFPNHWTLVTGLYPSEHGIVGNTFYDPILAQRFVNTRNLEPEFWQGGEPIWKTAERQGVRAAVHMWPGSEVPGVGPETDFDRYNGSELLSAKAERIMGWLDRDIDTRPQLILSYVPTVDQFGHKYGIRGKELRDSLKYVDDFIQLVRDEIKARQLDDVVNLVVVSDHGMAPTSNERLFYMDDAIDMDRIEHVDGWPLYGLRPKEEYPVENLYEDLSKQLADNEGYDVYLKENLPAEWNFGSNDAAFSYRIAPVWVVPKVGYSITTHKQMDDFNGQYKPVGVHGYNNSEVLMRAIFLGAGPHFDRQLSEGRKVLPFQNTEVYNIVCESLGIEPAPNNASGPVLSDKYILPDSFEDPTGFPDLPFKVEHIVEDATYDRMYRAGMNVPDSTTNTSPAKDLSNAEKSLSASTSSTNYAEIIWTEKETQTKETQTKETDTATTTSTPSEPGSVFGNIVAGFDDFLDGAAEQASNLYDNISDTIGGFVGGLFGGTSERSE